MDEQQIYNKIEDYAHGKLSAEEVEELWVKILENPELLSYLETIAHLKHISFSESVSESTTSVHSRKSRFRGTFWAVAAGMIIAVGILYYFQLSTKSRLPQAQAIVPASDYESVDVFRSVDSNLTPNQKEVNKGFAMMIRHQNNQAKAVFNKLLSQKPGNSLQAKIFFDLGAIAYNKQNFTTALDDFRLALSHSGSKKNEWLPEKINWYLGQTHLQLRQKKKTIGYIQHVVRYNGYYHSRAESLLTELGR